MALFTQIHVLISLVAILSGLLALYGLLRSRGMPGVTAVFLGFTIATSLTGFLFPIHGLTPALVVGALSLVLLLIAMAGRYAFHLKGPWRAIYVVCAVAALWFNVFVLIVQSFLKIPVLHALAPKGAELPFVAAQGVALLLFIALGFQASRRFRPLAP